MCLIPIRSVWVVKPSIYVSKILLWYKSNLFFGTYLYLSSVGLTLERLVFIFVEFHPQPSFSPVSVQGCSSTPSPKAARPSARGLLRRTLHARRRSWLDCLTVQLTTPRRCCTVWGWLLLKKLSKLLARSWSVDCYSKIDVICLCGG